MTEGLVKNIAFGAKCFFTSIFSTIPDAFPKDKNIPLILIASNDFSNVLSPTPS